jgi:hypothetical protein
MECGAPLSFTSTEVSAPEHCSAIAAARCARRRRGWDSSWAHRGYQLLRSAEGSVLVPGAPPVTSPPAKFRRSGAAPALLSMAGRTRVSAHGISPVLLGWAAVGRARLSGRPSNRIGQEMLIFVLFFFQILNANFENSYILF